MAKIKHIMTYRRAGELDILLSWQTRNGGQTDALFQWNGTGWTELASLPGTDLIYDSVTFMGQVYWVDGKNAIKKYSADTNTICDVNVVNGTAPVGQYIVVFQDRLVVGGDARTMAEIQAASLVWPADSNRDRVIYSESLDDAQWTPNNFIDADTGTGEVISGLGVNSITSAIKGAQTQLVIFKPTAIIINDGVLGAADEKLNVVSLALGCPGYHSIVNTPFGLIFCSKDTVCLLDTSGKEPAQIGVYISPAIKAVPEANQKWTAATYDNQTYKLSIADGTDNDNRNNSEWWLDLRPQVFPQEQNWYGPHSGDFIFQYEHFAGFFIGAQELTTTIWELDVEGLWGSMSAAGTPRTSTMTWPRFRLPNQTKGELDAFGITGTIAANVTLSGSVDVDRGSWSPVSNWTSPVSVPSGNPMYALFRPARFEGHDAQVSISHSAGSDIVVDSIYVRPIQRQRQSEKQSSSTQVQS